MDQNSNNRRYHHFLIFWPILPLYSHLLRSWQELEDIWIYRLQHQNMEWGWLRHGKYQCHSRKDGVSEVKTATGWFFFVSSGTDWNHPYRSSMDSEEQLQVSHTRIWVRRLETCCIFCCIFSTWPLNTHHTIFQGGRSS